MIIKLVFIKSVHLHLLKNGLKKLSKPENG